MGSIDFSKLEALAYRGFEDNHAGKDAITERGYSVVEGEDLPFKEGTGGGTAAEAIPSGTSPVPEDIELWRLFFEADVGNLFALIRAGKITVIEVEHNRACGVYLAHFVYHRGGQAIPLQAEGGNE